VYAETVRKRVAERTAARHRLHTINRQRAAQVALPEADDMEIEYYGHDEF